MFERVLNTSLKLDIKQQVNSLLKALLDWSFFNKNDISVPLTQIDSDEAAPRCPVRQLLLVFLGKLIGKHLCGTLFLIKFQAFTLIETPARKFSCRFLQILKEHLYLKNNSRRLFLQIQYRLIAIKIQIVFKLNWIFKVNSRKSVSFRLLVFSSLFFFVSKKGELYEYKSTSEVGTSPNSGKASQFVFIGTFQKLSLKIVVFCCFF